MPFYNIHQTQEVQNNNRIIKLGSGTNFDIKTLLPDVDYQSLTLDNFIVIGSRVALRLDCWASPRDSGVTSGEKTQTVYYTPSYSDGVLSVTVSGVNEMGVSASGNDGNSANGRLMISANNPVCYLVIGNIETL